jgi:hypothetical protein
LTSFGY